MQDHDPFRRNLLIDAHTEVLDVPPSELVGEIHLVVTGWIDLIVRAPRVTVGVFVARCVVVFGEGAGLETHIFEGISRVPVSSPRVDRVMS